MKRWTGTAIAAILIGGGAAGTAFAMSGSPKPPTTKTAPCPPADSVAEANLAGNRSGGFATFIPGHPVSMIACDYTLQQNLIVGKLTGPDGTATMTGQKLDAFVKQINTLPSVPVANVPLSTCPPPIPEQRVTLLIFRDATGPDEVLYYSDNPLCYAQTLSSGERYAHIALTFPGLALQPPFTHADAIAGLKVMPTSPPGAPTGH